MTSTVDTAVARLAAVQHGVVHRRQALEAGMTGRQISTRLGVGLMVPAHRGVYRLTGVPRSWEQDVMAACLAAGPAAVASHRCAARLWRLRGVERLGWRPLAFTWADAHERPHYIGSTVGRELRRAG